MEAISSSGCWLAESSSHDINQFSTALKGWIQEYDQVSAGDFSGNLKDIAMGGVRIFREQMSLPVAQHVHMPDGLINVLVPLTASAEVGSDSSRALFADSITLLPQNQDMYFVGAENTDYVVISVDQQHLLQHLCEADQAALLQSQRNYSLMVSPREMHHLRTLLPALVEEQLALPDAEQAARYRPLEHRLMDLVSSLYTGYDHDGEEICWRPMSRQHQSIVQRSHQYVLSSAGAEASILDVCRELNIPRRTLNYAFQKVAGMSPVKYLRMVKLNSARRDLLRSDDGIGDIAARYGFFHNGYFGQEYRRLFGETPSETRRTRVVFPVM